jgi:hypothetical protein
LILFKTPSTPNTIVIVLIVVVLVAATGGEVLVPRVVLGIVRVLGRTPVVASNSKVFTSRQGILSQYHLTTFSSSPFAL